MKYPQLFHEIILSVSIAALLFFGEASAATLVASWQDNSTNEDGFKIERGTSGTYVEIATVPANTVSYQDSGLLQGTTYCYRVRAFNAYGISDPSNESCTTTPLGSYTLSVSRTGAGSGTVSSSPLGISCGSDCSELYASGTIVKLSATPTSGSTFAGWSGDADCADGVVTVNANKSCTATFNQTNPVSQNYTLNVQINSSLSSLGGGGGQVTSGPAGITCGSDCSEIYSSGTVVYLTATPAPGSSFVGWSGDADCSDGTVTMNANKSCTATFQLNSLTLSVQRIGPGSVSSQPAGINCGTECVKTLAVGSTVTLAATAGAKSKFIGWSGACQGVGNCSVTLSNNTSVSANFAGPEPASVGIFRATTGEWFLDANGNGVWDGCNVDLCAGPFGTTGDLPVVGNWTGTGLSSIGVFRPSTGEWLLDFNGNGKWDGCKVDRCLKPLRPQATLPLVGDWTGAGFDKIGEMILEKAPKWYLDMNGDGVLQNCSIDACLKFGGTTGDLPVAGDWDGTGKTRVGIFRPGTGEWFLDLNGNGQPNDCQVDKCIKSFGMAGDLPLVGDWTGDGLTKIGLFRPATGDWLLDFNGNGKWEGCGVDACFRFLAPQQGDLPVAGAW